MHEGSAHEWSRLPDRRVRSILDNSPALTIVIDPDGVISYLNNGLNRLFPVDEHHVGRSYHDLSPPFALDFCYRIEDLLESPTRERFETPVDATDGERWIDVSVTPDHEGNRFAGLILLALDDTVRRRLLTSLTHRATHDPLTGLANRSLLLTNLSFQLALDHRERIPAALMFVGLDRFKSINDSLGPEAGDQLLLQTAARILDTVRASDTAARLGGDEFVVMLEGPLDLDTVGLLAERLHQQFSRPFTIDGQEVHVTASIGVSYLTDRRQTAEDLLRLADAAMYAAKDRGRNRYQIFDRELEAQIRDRHEVETALRTALSNQFIVHLQPEIELTTRQIVGAEALVRWDHPERGLIDAGSFIAVAEESGHIIELGNRVVAEAVELLAAWSTRPDLADLTLRVNVSSRQLAHPHCLDHIRTVLAERSIDPARMCLEFTEATLIDAERSLTVLTELRRLGLRLAIDDFGTGFSSLGYLKQFPIDILKIDDRFVGGLPDGSDDLAIVRSIVGLAGAFELELVAEGVEDHRQVDELERLGVHRAQGWLFGRPMAPDRFADVVAGANGR